MVREKKEAFEKLQKQKEQLEIQSETISKLTSEVEDLKSTETAVALFQKKYQKERLQKEQ